MVEKEYRAVSAIEETKILILRKIARILELESEILQRAYSSAYPMSMVAQYLSEVTTLYRFLKPFIKEYVDERKPGYKDYERLLKNEQQLIQQITQVERENVNTVIQEYMNVFATLLQFTHDFGLLDITYFVGTSSDTYDV